MKLYLAFSTVCFDCHSDDNNSDQPDVDEIQVSNIYHDVDDTTSIHNQMIQYQNDTLLMSV